LLAKEKVRNKDSKNECDGRDEEVSERHEDPSIEGIGCVWDIGKEQGVKIKDRYVLSCDGYLTQSLSLPGRKCPSLNHSAVQLTFQDNPGYHKRNKVP